MSATSFNDREKLASVVSSFRTGGDFGSATRIGSGHINDSWLIRTISGHGYVLQKINHHVFRDIPALTENIRIVTAHLEEKIASGIPEAGHLSAMKLVPAKDGRFFFRDPEGSWWRMYNHIEGSKSYDRVPGPLLAQEGGKAFGLFQLLTSDIPADTLKETIPGFHHIGKRLKAFHETVDKDPAGRVKDIKAEIAFTGSREKEMLGFGRLTESPGIPVRVTHNDTKFNNILFDDNNRAVCIVDLDTVMPGTVLYDFGDAIRTGANRGDEDEKDTDKGRIDMDLFAAYTRGYLEAAGRFLTPAETGNLAFSARFMTFIIGLRFLTDYIDGDRYYRIRFESHNLQRARAQFRLLETMEEKAGDMERIVDGIMQTGS